MTDVDKHSSLRQYGINYGHYELYSTNPWAYPWIRAQVIIHLLTPAFPILLNPPETKLVGANTPAYFGPTKKGGFERLTPGVNVMKLFSFVADDETK